MRLQYCPDVDRFIVEPAGTLVVVLGLNLALVGALVAVGITAHSLGVFAEGGDYLGDAAAIGGLTSRHRRSSGLPRQHGPSATRKRPLGPP